MKENPKNNKISQEKIKNSRRRNQNLNTYPPDFTLKNAIKSEPSIYLVQNIKKIEGTISSKIKNMEISNAEKM
jgi:hypothetical protein